MEKGILPIDVIGGCCSLEIDTYWSFHAGIDNYKFITENKDNIILLHIKDGIDGKPKALGEGNCDIYLRRQHNETRRIYNFTFKPLA